MTWSALVAPTCLRKGLSAFKALGASPPAPAMQIDGAVSSADACGPHHPHRFALRLHPPPSPGAGFETGALAGFVQNQLHVFRRPKWLSRNSTFTITLLIKSLLKSQRARRRGASPGRGGSIGAAMPLRWNGEAYRGINVVMLWAVAAEQGYVSNRWLTYRQAQDLGGQVTKGQKIFNRCQIRHF